MSAGATGRTLTGPQKCAVLFMAVGSHDAAKILQKLTSSEVETITREIIEMPSVEPDVVNFVLQEFQETSRKLAQTTARGGEDFARQLLKQALGETHAGAIIEKVRENEENAAFAQLKRAAPDQIAGALRGEHPQTIALVLSHLDGRHASAVIQALSAELGGDVLFRMARMERVFPEALALVESIVKRKVAASTAGAVTTTGGPGVVARLLNVTGGPLEEELMGAIEQRDAEIASKVKALMFVFEDILLIDSKGIQRLLREIDTKELALSLKAASDELKTHIKSQMSERAASALDEEIELMGPVRVKEVEAAHARIIEAVRRLEQAGEIIVKSQGADNEIIP